MAKATGFELTRANGSAKAKANGKGKATGNAKGGKAAATLSGSSARRPPRRRPPHSADRLVSAPVFILCTVRSGSTLLRVLLNSHSRIHAPHEMHFRDIEIRHTIKNAEKSSKALGLAGPELEYLLWDRMLHRELEHSGKDLIVEKTPGNVLMWRRIPKCWPDARFVFLLRHPASIASSWHAVRPQHSFEENVRSALVYMNRLEEARSELPGLTVRYEELTADPRGVTRRLCEFLGVDWEPEMLEYGEFAHGAFSAGLGDWTDKIRTGQVQAGRPLPAPEEIPEALRDICVRWGYLDEAALERPVPEDQAPRPA